MKSIGVYVIVCIMVYQIREYLLKQILTLYILGVFQIGFFFTTYKASHCIV